MLDKFDEIKKEGSPNNIKPSISDIEKAIRIINKFYNSI